jgi:hypothetical protein
METRKVWADMTKEERAELSRQKRVAVHELLQENTQFPKGLTVAFGKHGESPVVCLPNGVSEKGSPAYSLRGKEVTVTYNGLPLRVRINNISLSVIAEGGESMSNPSEFA